MSGSQSLLFAAPPLRLAVAFLGAAALVLAADRLAIPPRGRASVTIHRPPGRWAGDQLLRLLSVTYVFLFFFAFSWRPLYGAVATTTFCAVFTAICWAKFNFIREPLIFSDIALLPHLLKHREIFYATWLNAFVWIAAFLYIVGGTALFLLLEDSLLPARHEVLAYGAGILAWFVPLAFTLWKPAPQAVARAAERALRGQGPVVATMRYGAFLHLVLGFAAWWGADDPEMSGVQSKVDAKDIETAGAPLIVVWQSESFLDMRRLGISNLSLPALDALRKRACRWGLLGNVFEGGYTMRTEFAVLSGLDPGQLGNDAGHPYLSARRYGRLAWPSRLREAGWQTLFVHPYDRTFFMRHRALPELGFDRLIMLDDFNHAASPEAPYITDADLGRRVAQLCLEADQHQPGLVFVASMGNHGPWQPGRTAERLTDPLRIYCRLLEAADEALAALVQELERLERPVWLVFYGDHAPLLKSFADPFPDPRTDYAIAALGTARMPATGEVARVDVEPWNLMSLAMRLAATSASSAEVAAQ